MLLLFQLKPLTITVLICVDLNNVRTSKIFNTIRHQYPEEEPYDTATFPDHGYQRCFTNCYYALNCLSFVVIKQTSSGAGGSGIVCKFYRRTAHHLSLSPQQDSTLYSQVIEYTDCIDWYNAGARTTDVYEIVLPNSTYIRVRCQMENKDGGWMTFQHHFSDRVNFTRNWHAYKVGFGSVEHDFWLGNDILHMLTSRVGITYDFFMKAFWFNGARKISMYKNFRIGNESTHYVLNFKRKFKGRISLKNGTRFSTYDRLLDTDCASDERGGFWYKKCGGFFPNARWLPSETDPEHETLMYWNTLNSNHSLMSTELMIRRNN